MKHEEIFERLAPPPGGLAKLRARIEPRAHAPRRPLVFAFTFAAAAVAIVVFILARRTSAPDLLAEARATSHPSEVALGLARAPAARADVAAEARETTALAEVRTSNPEVAFYWASSTSWRDDAPKTAPPD